MTYTFDKSEYLKFARSQFKCDWTGIHGTPHWARVYNIGQMLGKAEGARLDVLELFAFLHDHKRIHEGYDTSHGAAAAESALKLRDKFFQIDDVGFDDLIYAMVNHSDGMTEHNINVECCWDSDRLDLYRVGIMPDPKYLCTVTAKNPSLIKKCAEASGVWYDNWVNTSVKIN